ncbi:hypothetical protein LTS18_007341 [Coniosporium uncinatum]|uniref:Uncharacterized protein n=1 Tax=Coniosporium uncinatum TaxID=93489 RepID=A0ACC3DPN1_9PEZI|nr:hypothetical protein LTS18_007341 [Coniosporium uncinatum]
MAQQLDLFGWIRIRRLDSEDQRGERGAMNAGVWLVRSARTGEVCVQKVCRAVDFERSQFPVPQEMAVMRYLSDKGGHENVNRLVSLAYDEGRRLGCLVLERCELGTLEGLVLRSREHRITIPEAFLWHIFLSIAEALAFIHYGVADALRNPIPRAIWAAAVHMDIKLSNIFISRKPSSRNPHYPTIVLGDFGCCERLDALNSMPTRVNATDLRWSPPEAPLWWATSDVWQLGNVMRCLASGWREPQDRNRPNSDVLFERRSAYLRNQIGLIKHTEERERITSVELPQQLVQARQAAVAAGMLDIRAAPLPAQLLRD